MKMTVAVSVENIIFKSTTLQYSATKFLLVYSVTLLFTREKLLYCKLCSIISTTTTSSQNVNIVAQLYIYVKLYI